MNKSVTGTKQKQLTSIQVHPVTWDVVDVNKKVAALNGDWENIDPMSIYSESTYLLLTNQVLSARWMFTVVSKVTYEDNGELYCTTCECEYKLNEPTLFKEGADILMDELKVLLKEELLNFDPDSIVVTATGFITVGKRNAISRTNRNRPKARPKG